MTEYLGNTAVIVALDDEPNDEGGLTADQLKAKFDEGLTEFVTWFNDTHKAEFEAKAPLESPTFTGTVTFPEGTVNSILHRQYMEV